MSSGSTAVFDRTQHRRASLRKSSEYFMLFLPVELCEDEAQEAHPKSTNITEELLVPGPALQKICWILYTILPRSLPSLPTLYVLARFQSLAPPDRNDSSSP